MATSSMIQIVIIQLLVGKQGTIKYSETLLRETFSCVEWDFLS